MALKLPDANDDSNLVPGWAKMQDEYGDYYINLYSKATSRIRPIRASVFDEGTFAPPPPEDANEKHQNPISPISPVNPFSPHSQQQQQMYNQQLYQQQLSQYYAQANAQQAFAQQQWQHQQQVQNGIIPYNQGHLQQQSSSVQTEIIHGTYPSNERNIIQDADDDESSSTSLTGSTSSSGSSTVGTESDSDELLEEDHAHNDNAYVNEIQSDVVKVKPKPVPPIKNSINEQQYKFQPIRPPKMSISMSNDSIKDMKGNGNDYMPSPAFNPNKISNMIPANVAVDSIVKNNAYVRAEEGTGVDNAPLDAHNDDADDIKAAPPNPVINHHESTIFNVMLQSADKKKHLIREENWDMLCDGIQSNCPMQDQYDVFKAMRKLSKNLLIDDEKYRTLYADNDMVQKKILGRVGGYEFLRGLGFKQGNDENELIVATVDKMIVNNAINVLQKRIDALKKRRHEWDPKYRKKRIVLVDAPQHIPQQKSQHIDEEQRQLEEAIALSQRQHIMDMRARQQRELDMASQNRMSSVNIFHPREEDDQKSVWM